MFLYCLMIVDVGKQNAKKFKQNVEVHERTL